MKNLIMKNRYYLIWAFVLVMLIPEMFGESTTETSGLSLGRQLEVDPFNLQLVGRLRQQRLQEQEQDRYAFVSFLRGLRACRQNEPELAVKWLAIAQTSPRIRRLHKAFVSIELDKILTMAGVAARQAECANCGGRHELDCPQCRGVGWFQCPRCRGAGKVLQAGSATPQDCPVCYGSGIAECSRCRSAGVIDCPDCQLVWLTPRLDEEIDQLLTLISYLPSLEAMEFALQR